MLYQPLPTDAEEENVSPSDIAGEESTESSRSEKSENGEEALAEGSEVTYASIFICFFLSFNYETIVPGCDLMTYVGIPIFEKASLVKLIPMTSKIVKCH